MQITIKAIGKLNTNLVPIIQNYLKRFRVLKINVAEHSNSNKALEWLFNNPPGSYNIVLTERGNNFTSVAFSTWLFTLANNSYSKINFLIGGAEGIPIDYINKADYCLSFSKLTFPHEICRLLLIEQLYRAETIFMKHPYHK